MEMINVSNIDNPTNEEKQPKHVYKRTGKILLVLQVLLSLNHNSVKETQTGYQERNWCQKEKSK